MHPRGLALARLPRKAINTHCAAEDHAADAGFNRRLVKMESGVHVELPEVLGRMLLQVDAMPRGAVDEPRGATHYRRRGSRPPYISHHHLDTRLWRQRVDVHQPHAVPGLLEQGG